MAEEAQELTVTHTGQPLVADIDAATTDDVAQAVDATEPTNVTVEIEPAG